jgi:exopolyphosphatase / guanosine-5'-triphosphate,3'-diphosphate pyrophosphatase
MNSSPVYASIDIGTNSVLLLVASFIENQLEVLDELQEIPRLGKGVDSDKNLHPESCERVISVLKKYRAYLEQNYPEVIYEVIVTATSAVRDSSNRNQFLEQIFQETGWEVRLLSGDEEAETTYSGAISVLPYQNKKFVVLDIGGGSTEIARGSGLVLNSGISVDMGSVRFSERYLLNDPPTRDQIEAVRSEVQSLLDQNSVSLQGFELVGVAGTVTSIAAILLGLNDYQAEKINGYRLKKSDIQRFINEFTEITSGEIEEKYSPFLKGRGDVITGGLIILDEFMKLFEFDELTVSTGGIRHGILISSFNL